MAIKESCRLPERAPLKDKLVVELSCEARKFVLYRRDRNWGRELASIHRLRSLSVMLQRADA
jgi:hypothetical protein